jgi:alkyl sulfatase BDS1-like metallo-beta-lactamase superfamily hydrolase
MGFNVGNCGRAFLARLGRAWQFAIPEAAMFWRHVSVPPGVRKQMTDRRRGLVSGQSMRARLVSAGLRKWKEGIRASAKTSRLDCACVRTSDQRGCTELEAQPEIAQIAGDLYRFQNNFHVLVFVVMPEGVVATDPIDANAAAWLRGQIQERFKQPVRYVIYSHDHADHIAGGAVLKEAGATVIAQLNGRGSNGCPPSKGFLGHVGGHRSLLDISCS